MGDIRKESSGSYYHLERKKGVTWFFRLPIYRHSRNSWQIEQYFIASIIQIVRICTGPDWLPEALQVSAAKKPLPVPGEWKAVPITWNHRETGIAISNKDLERPPLSNRINNGIPKRKSRKPLADLTFADLIRTQVLREGTGLETAADELGMSKSTLQRVLRSQGTSYSKTLEDVRIELAKDYLVQGKVSISEISERLGYKYPPNFSRAFLHLTGVPPNEYRHYSHSNSAE
jgi:AraC-like DNA-binding protein